MYFYNNMDYKAPVSQKEVKLKARQHGLFAFLRKNYKLYYGRINSFNKERRLAMLVETRKELRKEIEGIVSLCVAQTVDLDVLGNEDSLKAVAAAGKIVNLYLTDMEEEAALLTEINEKLDKILK